MKDASPEVIAYLNQNNKFYLCDLYEITLADGTVFRYADYDRPIVWNGHTWLCTGPVFERGKTSMSGKITVDSLSVTVTTDANDKIDGVTWMNLAHNGGFRGATLKLYRCIMSSPGIVVGAMLWFPGPISVGQGGGMEMGWNVKSRMSKANIDYPFRLYYPTCPYVLYGDGCGLSRDDFAVSGTVTAAGGVAAFMSSLRREDGYFDQGYVKFTTGDLAGVAGPVKYSTAAGAISMLSGFGKAPAVGDAFIAYPGCDRTPAICASKFGNWSKNRATPYIPLKETVL